MSANNSITPQSRRWRVSLISARLIATTSTFFGDSVRSRFRRETGSASKLFKYPPFRFLLWCDSLMFSFHAKPKKLPESSYQLRGVRWVFSPSYRNNQLNSLSSKVGDCVKNQLDGLIESSLCDSFSLQSRRESRYNRKFPLSNLPKMRKTKVIPRRSDQLFKLLSLSIYF